MFAGSMVALVTPMAEDGAIDYTRLAELIEFHIEEGSDALVIGGTTGESASLETGEFKKLVSTTVRQVRGRVPVIAGTGSPNTNDVITMTGLARELEADAALIVAPAYVKPMQAGLIGHYQKIADATELPIILYNVPGRTACDLLPASVAALAEHPRIIGIKEATGDVNRVTQILELAQDGFEIYSGDDITSIHALAAGAHGVISVTANVAPRLMHEMCDAAMAGEADQAEAISRRLGSLHKALFVESNPIPVKWALREMHMIGGGIRLPLTVLAEEHHLVLRNAMRDAGVI